MPARTGRGQHDSWMRAFCAWCVHREFVRWTDVALVVCFLRKNLILRGELVFSHRLIYYLGPDLLLGGFRHLDVFFTLASPLPTLPEEGLRSHLLGAGPSAAAVAC